MAPPLSPLTPFPLLFPRLFLLQLQLGNACPQPHLQIAAGRGSISRTALSSLASHSFSPVLQSLTSLLLCVLSLSFISLLQFLLFVSLPLSFSSAPSVLSPIYFFLYLSLYLSLCFSLYLSLYVLPLLLPLPLTIFFFPHLYKSSNPLAHSTLSLSLPLSPTLYLSASLSLCLSLIFMFILHVAGVIAHRTCPK